MLEIIAQSVEDAKAIEAAGGHRIELVSGIIEGGLTPSYAMIDQVVKAVTIPVNVMVRPHSHSFEYSSGDFAVMMQDIEVIKSLGCSGLVLGCLKDGNINTTQFNKLIESLDFKVTFHRAIDETINIKESYKILSNYEKITQILTSAGPGIAYDHLEVLDELYKIMPSKLLIGSGVGLNNIALLYKKYPKANFHIGSDVRIGRSFKNKIDEKRVKEILKLMSK